MGFTDCMPVVNYFSNMYQYSKLEPCNKKFEDILENGGDLG